MCTKCFLHVTERNSSNKCRQNLGVNCRRLWQILDLYKRVMHSPEYSKLIVSWIFFLPAEDLQSSHQKLPCWKCYCWKGWALNMIMIISKLKQFYSVAGQGLKFMCDMVKKRSGEKMALLHYCVHFNWLNFWIYPGYMLKIHLKYCFKFFCIFDEM